MFELLGGCTWLGDDPSKGGTAAGVGWFSNDGAAATLAAGLFVFVWLILFVCHWYPADCNCKTLALATKLAARLLKFTELTANCAKG